MTVFATRGGPFSIGSLVVGTVMMVSASALANPIVNYNINVLGGQAGPYNNAFAVAGVQQADPQKYLHAGVLWDPSIFGDWQITYNTTSDPDPSVGQGSLSSGLTIENRMADIGQGLNHLQFTIRLTLPVYSPNLPASFGGNAGMTLNITPGASPGIVTTVGADSIWTGQINGADEASLFNAGFFIGGSNGPATANSGMTNIPLFQRNFPINDIGIEVHFDLSPGETVTFNDFFAFIPGPGSLAFFGLVGLMGGRRRRS